MSRQTQDNQAQGGFAFPKEWTLFGPVGKDDPEPDFAGINDVPAKLTVDGQRLAGRKAEFADNGLDLGALLCGKGRFCDSTIGL